MRVPSAYTVLPYPGTAKSLNALASTSADSITGRQTFPTNPSAISAGGRSSNSTQPAAAHRQFRPGVEMRGVFESLV
jgi:hypothetical protein